MSAYVISEVDVRDAAGFETYRTIAAKAIAQYGGRYLVRGGAASIAEGGPPPKNIIVVEFPSMKKSANGMRHLNTPKRSRCGRGRWTAA